MENCTNDDLENSREIPDLIMQNIEQTIRVVQKIKFSVNNNWEYFLLSA